MSDVVVTVPKRLWAEWLDEGALAWDGPDDDPAPTTWAEYHFWLYPFAAPQIAPGERVYVVAHGRLRGYAPLVRTEPFCQLDPSRMCLLRQGGAVALTVPEPVRGFQGWRYRWWDRSVEVPFPDWRRENVA